MGTTLIRPADSAVDRVTAAGNIELVDTQQVVARVNGYVDEVLVEVGDVVSSGDLLVALDRDDLRRAVDQARINLTSAELQLENLLANASAAELAAAAAELKSAEENLAEVQNGASEGELAAARSNAASAWARYDDLRNGASENERIHLAAAVENAHVAMQEAQTEYDKVSWREDVGNDAAGCPVAAGDNLLQIGASGLRGGGCAGPKSGFAVGTEPGPDRAAAVG